MKKLIVASILMAVLLIENAVAVPDFLAAWKARYPESTSSKRECQLCHYNAGGGDGWNAYGWDIRGSYILAGRVNINAAFFEVEMFNSDCDPLNCDPANLDNPQEIAQGLDPGWAPGPVNFIFFKDNSILENIRPPFIEGDDAAQLCLPIVTQLKTVTVICL